LGSGTAFRPSARGPNDPPSIGLGSAVTGAGSGRRVGRRGCIDQEDVVPRDGTTVRTRLAIAEDLDGIEGYLIGLSPESRRLRFGAEVT
jgi:hypothetical protein